MVEFADFVAVFEAPTNEERSLAVIEAIAKLAPGKPIRWLITSHPHFDHIGGLRTYLHIGATIVTHMKNLAFLNRDVLNYEPRTVKPDIVAKWPPTEVSEGYNYEAVQESYVITDNRRILRVYYVQPLRHVEGMLMAYLPAERIAFEADLFDTHEPARAAQLPSMRVLANQVERMKLEVDDAGAGAREASAVEHVPGGVEVSVRREPISRSTSTPATADCPVPSQSPGVPRVACRINVLAPAVPVMRRYRVPRPVLASARSAGQTPRRDGQDGEHKRAVPS